MRGALTPEREPRRADVYKRQDYTLVRSRRRTLSMELKRDGAVVVHAPLRLGVEKIDAVVAAHEAWPVSYTHLAALLLGI